MNTLYVVDTHVLIWYFIGSKRLQKKLKEKIDAGPEFRRATVSSDHRFSRSLRYCRKKDGWILTLMQCTDE